MRILVLTDPYGKPSFGPRLRYFCNDWIRRGHRIRVITEEFEPIPFEHKYPIDIVPSYRNRLDWFIKSIWSLLTDWRNRHFSHCLQEMTKEEPYDIVFCTTFSTFPLRAALEIARIKRIPLHVDLRDLDEQVPGAQYQNHRGWWTKPLRTWYKRVNIHRRNQVLKEANSISTVSPWHVDFLKQFNPNVHLIYNGYDPEQFYFEPVKSKEFLVSYIGKIYEFQHPDPLLERLRSTPGVIVNLHTSEHNPIPLTEVGNEIRRSSVMIVLTDLNAKGMMTTKFFEALGCEKPIICYPSDHGLLAKTIQDTNAGIASDDLEEIRRFVEEKYQEWKEHGYTRQAIIGKEQYNRQHGTEKLETILHNDLR